MVTLLSDRWPSCQRQSSEAPCRIEGQRKNRFCVDEGSAFLMKDLQLDVAVLVFCVDSSTQQDKDKSFR